MKTFVSGMIVAATMALAVPTPASALGIHIGPRGVGVNLGHRRGFGYHRGYRRPLVGRRFGHRGFRRF